MQLPGCSVATGVRIELANEPNGPRTRSAPSGVPGKADAASTASLASEGSRGRGETSRAEAVGAYVIALASGRAFWSPSIRDIAKRILERVP